MITTKERDKVLEEAARRVAAMGPNEFAWAADAIRELKSTASAEERLEATEEAAVDLLTEKDSLIAAQRQVIAGLQRQLTIALKLHEIQEDAFNEIKDEIMTRNNGEGLQFWSDEQRQELVDDIHSIAGFASQVSLTNPHYDGYSMIEKMEYNPVNSILSQAKAKDGQV